MVMLKIVSAPEYYPAWEPPVSCLRAIRKLLSSEPPKTQDIVVLPLLVLNLTEAVFNSFYPDILMILSHQQAFLISLNHTAFSGSFHL